jgi:hypothetical protein
LPRPVSAVLESEGIKASVIKILAENGFHTCESIAYTPRKALEALKGMSEQVLNKLYEAVKRHVAMGFTTASEIAVTRKSMVKLNTGSLELNKVLGGGIETGRCVRARRGGGARARARAAQLPALASAPILTCAPRPAPRAASRSSSASSARARRSCATRCASRASWP